MAYRIGSHIVGGMRSGGVEETLERGLGLERTKGGGKTHWRVCASTLPAADTARRDELVEWHPPNEGCLAVSIGIGGNWGFEDSLADAGCDVHEKMMHR